MDKITNQKDLRNEFWIRHPQFKRRGNLSQTSYHADIRIAWCDFVEQMVRDGGISEDFAKTVTL